MLGKNNSGEKLKKLDMQAKKERFSIRKLTLGTTSILLGFTFMNMGGQTAKADTLAPDAVTSEVQNSATDSVDQQESISSGQDNEASTVSNDDSSETVAETSNKDPKVDLTTYSGLKSFLRDGSTEQESSPSSGSESGETATSSSSGQEEQATANSNGTEEEPAAILMRDQQPSAQGISQDVSDWAGFVGALENNGVDTINLTSDVTATQTNQTYTIPNTKTIEGNHHTLDISSNIIQDDVYQYGITFNNIKLVGLKPNNNPASFNFYGYDNDKAVTLNNVESDNVSYDALIKFENNVTLNYNTNGNIFSDYAEPTATTGSTVNIDFAPMVGTSSSFICDIFIIEDNAKVTANISNTMSALRGTGTIDNARIEVGEHSTFDLTINPSVNFLYRVDPGIPPLKLELFNGSTTHIKNNASDVGVNPGQDNQLNLIADTPKIFELTSSTGDVNNFNFPMTSISGDKMGLIDDSYKWIIETSDNANIIDSGLTEAQMKILANPTLVANIPTDGKANKTFQDLNTKEDFQTVISSAGGFNGSAGFALGTDLYDGWHKTDAGRYNVFATAQKIHAGQISGLGTAEDILNVNDNGAATTISALKALDDSINPSNKTITSVAWLPNQAMDNNGNLTSSGIVANTAGQLVANPTGITATELGNAVIRVTYGDGTTDDVPVKINLISAGPSGIVQYVSGTGIVPTPAQAADAVSFDGDASNWNLSYEWYKADGTGPLTPADMTGVAGSTNNPAAVLVHYKNKTTGADDGTQLISVNIAVDPDDASKSGAVADSAKTITIPVVTSSSTGYLVPQFSTPNSFLTGTDLNNINTVSWVDTATAADVMGTAGTGKTASVLVTFNDGSTKIVPDVQFDVVGATATAPAQTTPSGTVPTAAQAAAAVSATDPDISDNYDVVYSWAQDDTGTPMTASYASYTNLAPSKTKSAWVVATYYKKHESHTAANSIGQQIVSVNLDLTKTPVELYHSQLAGSGADSKGISVPKNIGLTDNDAKNAIYKPTGFPADATFTWDGTAPDTSSTGDKQAWVKVTYNGGATDRIPVLVNVYDIAFQTEPHGKKVTGDVGSAVPDAATAIVNSADLPVNTTYTWITPPDMSQSGTSIAEVKVTYPDNSSENVLIPVVVNGPSKDKYNAQGSRTTIAYGSGKTASAADAQTAIGNTANLPAGTTYTWQTAPRLGNLNDLGDQAAAVKVTYPDGTSVNVPVIIHVTNDATTSIRPRAKNVCLSVGDALPDAAEAIVNKDKLTNVQGYQYLSTPSVSNAGVTQVMVRVTFNDGSTRDVPTQVIVDALVSSDATLAQKNKPHVTTVRVGLGSAPAAADVITNFAEMTGHPTAEWVDPDFAREAVKTPGLKQSQVKLTFNDGTSKIVTGYVRVLPQGEKRLNTAEGKTVNKQVGDSIIAAELVDNLPAGAVASFLNPSNITDGKVVAEGSYPEIVHIKFSDGSTKDVMSMLVVSKQSQQQGSNSGSSTSTTPTPDSVKPVGGTVTIPVGTDLSQDTDYAKQAISNWASMPAGTSYRWAAIPDTSKAGSVPGTVIVTLNDGTSYNVSVTVKIADKAATDKEAVDVTLRHDAYLYTKDGHRITEIILKTGSVVTTYGIKKINGRDFYILDNDYYLATGNVLGLKRKLIHNAYVYNKYGKRIGKTVYKAGRNMLTHGEPLNIHGEKFYKLGNGRFLKAANFKKPKKDLLPVQEIAADPSKKRVMHNSYLYDENGKRANQIILRAGSRVKIAKSVHNMAGERFYKTDSGLYIMAGNITGTSRRLNHNAYVYSRYNKRANKRVLKRGQSVTTYGEMVKLHGKHYYIIGNDTYIKAANF